MDGHNAAVANRPLTGIELMMLQPSQVPEERLAAVRDAISRTPRHIAGIVLGNPFYFDVMKIDGVDTNTSACRPPLIDVLTRSSDGWQGHYCQPKAIENLARSAGYTPDSHTNIVVAGHTTATCSAVIALARRTSQTHLVSLARDPFRELNRFSRKTGREAKLHHGKRASAELARTLTMPAVVVIETFDKPDSEDYAERVLPDESLRDLPDGSIVIDVGSHSKRRALTERVEEFDHLSICGGVEFTARLILAQEKTIHGGKIPFMPILEAITNDKSEY